MDNVLRYSRFVISARWIHKKIYKCVSNQSNQMVYRSCTRKQSTMSHGVSSTDDHLISSELVEKKELEFGTSKVQHKQILLFKSWKLLISRIRIKKIKLKYGRSHGMLWRPLSLLRITVMKLRYSNLPETGNGRRSRLSRKIKIRSSRQIDRRYLFVISIVFSHINMTFFANKYFEKYKFIFLI